MKFYKTISVFALAFLVLLSSSSFIVGVHFCSGTVAHVALLSEAEKCAMENSLPPCHKQVTAPCCDDETIFHESEGFKASSSENFVKASAPVDIDVPAVLISYIIPEHSFVESSFFQYDPPLRSCDRVISLQVFLI